VRQTKVSNIILLMLLVKQFNLIYDNVTILKKISFSTSLAFKTSN
jgi:hypothetical protein